MSRVTRTYYYAILGAIGGLIGWQISNLIGLSFSSNLYLSEVVVGAILGFCLGFPLGGAEGIVGMRPLQALRKGTVSGLLGLLAGAIGLPVAEFLYQGLGAGFLSRAIRWGFLGFLIGLAEGATGGAQWWKGALGGGLGGFLGGFLLEGARRWAGSMASGKIIGLVLLGSAIGAFIAFIVVLLSRAWLEITSGKLQGSEFILDKFLPSASPSAMIGSSPLKAEIPIPDPDIDPQHAILKGAESHFTIKDISIGGVFLGNRKIEQARLIDGEVIRMGNTTMVYRERR